MSVRARLTLAYGAVFLLGTGIVLGASWLLVSAHLQRTMGDAGAADALRGLASSYGLVAGGLALLSGAFGWVVAGRALRPLEETLEQQAALVQAQRQFVANASHELRSPLTVMRTEVDVTLADPRATTAELREMGGVVLDATDRTDALLDALLALATARPELVRHEPVDLVAAVDAAVRSTAAEADAARVQVHVQAAPAVVAGDPALMERLVANLVENAVRHNREHGRVEVRVGGGLVRIANDGAVIAPEDARRLTEPFERLGRTRGDGGTGLGLSIAAAVAAAHRGTLELEARREGGLVATVRLPSEVAEGDRADGARSGQRKPLQQLARP